MSQLPYPWGGRDVVLYPSQLGVLPSRIGPQTPEQHTTTNAGKTVGVSWRIGSSKYEATRRWVLGTG